MKKNQTRIFVDNDIQYVFNSLAFRSCVDRYAKEEKMSKGMIIDDLAKELCVSPDAIRNWKYGKNGPSDLDSIKKAALIFHIDWKLLVKRVNGEMEMPKQLTDRQKDAAKRIYDVLIWFLEEFNNTDGFNDWWLEFKDQGEDSPEDCIYDRIAEMNNRINLVFEQEYFDLHNHEIYDEFGEFICEDLREAYTGKVSYAYRLEANGEDSPMLWQDYEKAMNRLNMIIDRYI